MMRLFFYKDMASLQAVLEGIAMQSNGAACEYYNYCKFCKEARCFIRQSETPCADAFIASGANYVYCDKVENASERKENYRKYIMYCCDLVNVHYANKSGDFVEHDFSYIADVPLEVGDIVYVPTKFGIKKARVCKTGVQVSEITCRVGELRHITEAATPGGDIFNGFFN